MQIAKNKTEKTTSFLVAFAIKNAMNKSKLNIQSVILNFTPK